MKLTEWYLPKQSPVRSGVYERRLMSNSRGRLFSFWDGRRWFYLSSSPKMALLAYQERNFSTVLIPWRGIEK